MDLNIEKLQEKHSIKGNACVRTSMFIGGAGKGCGGRCHWRESRCQEKEGRKGGGKEEKWGERAEIEREREEEERGREEEGEGHLPFLVLSGLGGKKEKEKWREVSLCAGVCECGGAGRASLLRSLFLSLPPQLQGPASGGTAY